MNQMLMLEDAQQDDRWLRENFEKVQAEYPNRFVAVSGERIIADGPDARQVVRGVEKAGRDPATVLVEFIPKKGLVLIL